MNSFIPGSLWSEDIAQRDILAMEEAGYGGTVPLGKSPALLLIDVTINFTGLSDDDVEESKRKFPNSCGVAAKDAVPVIAELCSSAREHSVPVIYTRGPIKKDHKTLGQWANTNSKMSIEDDSVGESFLDEIAPVDGDVVIEKLCPSGFFGTPLRRYLHVLGIDTVLVGGASTSGCVRATVVDGFSHGFSMATIADASFDRSQTSHLVSLFDMHYKYAQVVNSAGVVEYFGALGR